MISIRKGSGLILLALGLGVWRAWGQTSIEGCDPLRTGIENEGTSFELQNDITCDAEIIIGADIDVTIDGAGFTLQIDATFLHEGDNSAVFYNQGTLTLTELTVTVEDAAVENKVRAIFNEGDLTVNSCSFTGLNLGADPLENGGAIYSSATGKSVVIENSEFNSNGAGINGGAIYADGTEELTIIDCDFSENEAGTNGSGEGSGGDVYAVDGVTLTVESSKFQNSAAEFGGAAIKCCGASIIGSWFTGSESGSGGNEHYGGAVLVGTPGSGCTHELEVSNSTFAGCTVQPGNGAGGSLAIFDTSATLDDCLFDSSQGTAVLFQSSDAGGAHQISMNSMEFYSNTEPSSYYSSDGDLQQGTAVVLENTAAEEDETVAMGTFNTVHCFGNDPYECEMVLDLAVVTYAGDIKCQICNIDNERQWVGLDEDSIADEGDTDASSSTRSSDSNEGIVIGLSLALGLTLVVIGALAVWKFRVRKNARRLMEDMGDGDL